MLPGAFPSLVWVCTALKVTELGGATPPCPGKVLAEVKVLGKIRLDGEWKDFDFTPWRFS